MIRSWYPVRWGLFPQSYRNTPSGASAYTVLANVPRVAAQNQQTSSWQEDRLTDDRFPGAVFDCLKFGAKQHCLLSKQTQRADRTLVAFVVDMRRYAIALSILINYATIWLDVMWEVPLFHQMRHQLHQNRWKFWHQTTLSGACLVEVEESSWRSRQRSGRVEYLTGAWLWNGSVRTLTRTAAPRAGYPWTGPRLSASMWASEVDQIDRVRTETGQSLSIPIRNLAL